MEVGLKWVHMARYELIFRLDGALWLTIIFKPLWTPTRAITVKKMNQNFSPEKLLNVVLQPYVVLLDFLGGPLLLIHHWGHYSDNLLFALQGSCFKSFAGRCSAR